MKLSASKSLPDEAYILSTPLPGNWSHACEWLVNSRMSSLILSSELTFCLTSVHFQNFLNLTIKKIEFRVRHLS